MATKDMRVGIGCLFATGNDPKRDAMLHVGGTRFSSNRDPVEKDWILNAKRRITKRIFNLSRVSKPESEKHPTWSRSAGAIQEFFSSLDVLFVVRVSGQLEWFRDRILTGKASKPVLVDLLHLYQFFCPEKDPPYTEVAIMDRVPVEGGFALPRLRTGLESMLHDVLKNILDDSRKDNNVIATPVYGLLEQALAGDNAPDDMGAVWQVAGAACATRWDTGQATLRYDAPTAQSNLDLQASVEELSFLGAGESGQREDTLQKRRRIKWDQVRQGLRNISAGVTKFEERPQQMEYAEFCTAAMNKPGAYALEAGTGTGKTLAYLISACEYARLNPTRIVVIATSTKNLMRQVYEKDWRVVQSMPNSFYSDLSIAELKGKQNYLCISGLQRLYLGRRSPFELGKAPTRLGWLYLFLLLTKCKGQIEGVPLGFPERYGRLNEFAIACNAEEVCHFDSCSVGHNCVYPRVLMRARRANILLTNHHKVPSLDDAILERESVCIIDEADLFPDNLRSADSINVSRSRLQRFLQQMLGSKNRRSLVRILQDGLDRDREASASSREIRAYLTRIERDCENIKDLQEKLKEVEIRGPFGARWQDLSGAQRGKLQNFFEQLEQAATSIADCWDRIETKKNLASKGNKASPRQSNELRAIQQVNRTASELASDLVLMNSDIDSEHHVLVYQNGDWYWESLRVPFNLPKSEGSGGELVKDLSSDSSKTVLFTSATLFVDGTLHLFAKELFGTDSAVNLFEDTKQLKSPFKYRQQVAGAVAAYLPAYSYKGNSTAQQEELASELARTVALLCVAVNGRTLILFTSSSEMRKIFDRVSPTLMAHDIEPLIQNGPSRPETETFRVREQSVLFGVDRFWTGVDFPGPTLSQVIVVRLPNPPLGRPLVKHRRELYSYNEFWRQWYGPRTRLRLRQGFGRLIRRRDDRGIFILLDKRILGKMRPHLRALPVDLEPVDGTAVEMAQWAVQRLGLGQEINSRRIDLRALHARLSSERPSSHERPPWN